MKYVTALALVSLLSACGGPAYQTGPTTTNGSSAEGEDDLIVLQKKTCKSIFDTIDLIDEIIKRLDRPGDEKERREWCDTRSDLEGDYVKANCTDLMLPAAPSACLLL